MGTPLAAPGAPPSPIFKIGVQGLAAVGKTSLSLRFARNTFDLDTCAPTVLVDFFLCRVRVAGFRPTSSDADANADSDEQHDVRLQIYDTAGQECFESGVAAMMRNLDGCLVVFSLTSRASYRRAQKYIESVRAMSPRAEIVLVGNKLDALEACTDTRAADEAAPRLAATLDLARAATRHASAAAAAAAPDGVCVELLVSPRTFGELASAPETRFGLGPRLERSGSSAFDSDSNASVLSLDAESAAVVGTAPLQVRRDAVVPWRRGPDPALRAVARSEAAAYAAARNYAYVETSALAGTHVLGAFRLLAERIAAAAAPHAAPRDASLVDLGAASSWSLPSLYAADVDAALDRLDAGLAEAEPRRRRECAC